MYTSSPLSAGRSRAAQRQRSPQSARRWPLYLQLVFGLLLCNVLLLYAHADEEMVDAEYRVKAAYLYKFALYVEWPDSASLKPGAPLVMGVAGNDSLATALDGLLPGRTANGRALTVKRVSAATPLNGLHVLFVGKSEMAKWKQWHAQSEALPILIVTEADGALAQGSIINFVWVDRHIRFEIGLGAAEKRGLKLSSRLLAVAQQVKTEVP